jgi:hypothetical protein
VAYGFTTAPLWVLLFALTQTTDVLTTAVDRSRGAIEAEPVSDWLLSQGGLGIFWMLKLSLVAFAAGVLWLVIRWARGGAPGARRIYRLVIVSIQVVTTLLALVSLQNALLSTSL